MTGIRTISTVNNCALRSGTQYHYCGGNVEGNLYMKSWAGFTYVATNRCIIDHYDVIESISIAVISTSSSLLCHEYSNRRKLHCPRASAAAAVDNNADQVELVII